MVFGVPILVELGPSISVPGLFGSRTIYPVWIAAALVALLLVQLAIRWVGNRIYYRAYRWKFHDWMEERRTRLVDGEAAGEWGDVGPRPFSIEWLEAEYERERTRWSRFLSDATGRILYEPLKREAKYRALPLLVALTVSGQQGLLWFLVGGALLQAYSQWEPSYPANLNAISGLLLTSLFVFLWWDGLWWVAILVQIIVLTVLFSIVGIRRRWKEVSSPFAPGEQFTVQIPDPPEIPDHHGLVGVEVRGERLYLAGLKPGEGGTVRVATTLGRWGFGFPVGIDRLPEPSR